MRIINNFRKGYIVASIIMSSLRIPLLSTEGDRASHTVLPSLPSEIVESFSKLGRELDEDYKNTVLTNIVTNEGGTQAIITSLARPPGQSSGIHIGFSGFLNLDIIAARKSILGLIADINDNNIRMFEVLKTLFTSKKYAGKIESREKFIETLIDYLKSEGKDIYIEEAVDDFNIIRKELDRKGSWLQRDDRFNYIKEMFRQGRIVYTRIDIRDSEKFKIIERWLGEVSLRVDTIYLSNMLDYIEDFFSLTDRLRAYRNAISLANDKTRLITATGTGLLLTSVILRKDDTVMCGTNLGGRKLLNGNL